MLGTTLDDAAGEAFDKGARLLGLGYPGGAEIDRLARDGDPEAYDFPVARVPGLDFSFSGLKTALLYAVRDLEPDELEARRADLAASYQRAIVRALVGRTIEAAERLGADRIAIVGGVAANSELRAALPDAAAAPLELCTDNAAMIASAARFSRARGRPASPGRLCGGVARLGIAVLAAIVAAAVLAVPDGGGGAPPATPTRLASAAAWNGLVGGARAEVGTGQRVLVVLTAFSLADRVQRAGGLATDAEERRWTAGAAAAQQQFISDVGRAGVAIRPEFRFTRTLNGFSAVLDPRAIALIERTPGVKGVYPVRVAFPASLSPRALRVAAASAARPGVRLAGIAGRGVLIALLDTGVDAGTPYLHGHVLPGLDIAGTEPSAQAQAKPTDPSAARGARHRDGRPARRCRRAGAG